MNCVRFTVVKMGRDQMPRSRYARARTERFVGGKRNSLADPAQRHRRPSPGRTDDSRFPLPLRPLAVDPVTLATDMLIGNPFLLVVQRMLQNFDQTATFCHLDASQSKIGRTGLRRTHDQQSFRCSGRRTSACVWRNFQRSSNSAMYCRSVSSRQDSLRPGPKQPYHWTTAGSDVVPSRRIGIPLRHQSVTVDRSTPKNSATSDRRTRWPIVWLWLSDILTPCAKKL